MRTEDLKRAASSYKASTRVGADGFHPKVPSDLSTETCRQSVEVLSKVEQRGDGTAQATTLFFFLLPKNVTSERPLALFSHSHSVVGVVETASNSRIKEQK